MRANLIVCGVPRESIEISDDSIIGQLLAGKLTGAMTKLDDMKAEINEIGGEGTCRVNIVKAAISKAKETS